MSKAKPLTAREALFVREYLLSGKPTEAYTKAGYSPKSARANAARMMDKENVSAAIDRGNLKARDRYNVTVDKLVAEFSHLAFTGMSRFTKVGTDGLPSIDLSECTARDLDALSEITVETYTDGKGENAREVKRIKIKLIDRLQAMGKLGMHLGMFKDKDGDPPMDSLGELLKDIIARGSAIPVKPQGPLGSEKLYWKK